MDPDDVVTWGAPRPRRWPFAFTLLLAMASGAISVLALRALAKFFL